MDNENIKEILYYWEKYHFEDCMIDGKECKLLYNYITNLQQLEQEHQKINGELRERIAYLERSNDRREDTILGLRQEINDVEDKNSKLEIALQNIQEDYDRRVKEIDVLKKKLDRRLEENERLKEENNNKAMNDYAHAIDESWYRELYDDYKSRCEQALDKLYCYGEIFDSKILQQFQKEMKNILQNGSDSQ